MTNPAELDRRHVRLTMRDGVRLSAYVWVPPSGGAGVPTVLMANPYAKDIYFGPGKVPYIRRFHEAGYAVAIVDLRGTGASEGGKPDAFSPDERDDIADSIRELARGPWSNGELTAWGMSYGGITALHAATSGCAELKAAVAIEGSMDPYAYEVMRGGVLGLAMIIGEWSSMTLALANVPPSPNELAPEAFLERLRCTRPWHHNWARHPNRDAYWAGRGHDPNEITAPTLFVTGWRGTQLRAAWTEFAGSPPAAKMICGPWPHAMPDERPVDALDSVGLAIGWFDEHLGRRPPVRPHLPKISCYVLGAGYWEAHEADRGPGRATFRLGPDLRLRAGGTGGHPGPDAHVPVGYSATVGVASGIGMYAANASGLAADTARSTTWTSEPLAAPLDIYGRPALQLAVSVPAAGSDIAAKLVDLSPDGGTTLIAKGFLRCPGETAVALEMDPIRYRVVAGHSLALVLAAADFPEYWPHPSGTGYRVGTGGDASALILPVLDRPAPRVPPGALPAPPSGLAAQLRAVATRADDGYAVEFDGDRVSISGGSDYFGTSLHGEPVSLRHRLTITGVATEPDRAALTTRTTITVGTGAATRSAHSACEVTATAMRAQLHVTADGLDHQQEFAQD